MKGQKTEYRRQKTKDRRRNQRMAIWTRKDFEGTTRQKIHM